MLLSLYLILGVFGVIREPHLPPRVEYPLCTDFVLHVNDPMGSIAARGSGDRDIWIL